MTSISLGMPSAPPPVLAPRRQTRQIQVGKVGVGSDHPISVQSMTTTLTSDVNATLQQIAELTASGCDIVREMFDSSLRAGRYVLENIGLTEYEAAEAERVFYQHDRHSVQELAKLWRDDIPSVDNEPYIARAKELERDLEALLLAQLQKEDAA